MAASAPWLVEAPPNDTNRGYGMCIMLTPEVEWEGLPKA